VLNKAIESVKMINNQSGLMRNLMMDLLDLAQMEKNTFKLNQAYFSMFEVIEQAFKIVEHYADVKRVTLKPPQVSTAESNIYKHVYGDKNRFLQVIINFLSNSLKFSKMGSEVQLHLELQEIHNLVSTDFD
jgi:signal transduction histidine kinase